MVDDLPDDLPQPQSVQALIEVLKDKVCIEQDNWNTAKLAYDYAIKQGNKPSEEVTNLLSYSTGRKRLCQEIVVMLEGIVQINCVDKTEDKKA